MHCLQPSYFKEDCKALSCHHSALSPHYILLTILGIEPRICGHGDISTPALDPYWILLHFQHHRHHQFFLRVRARRHLPPFPLTPTGSIYIFNTIITTQSCLAVWAQRHLPPLPLTPLRSCFIVFHTIVTILSCLVVWSWRHLSPFPLTTLGSCLIAFNTTITTRSCLAVQAQRHLPPFPPSTVHRGLRSETSLSLTPQQFLQSGLLQPTFQFYYILSMGYALLKHHHSTHLGQPHYLSHRLAIS